MYLPVLGVISGKSFLTGAVATVAASLVARPLIVGVVRAGYGVSDFVADSWSRAKAEARSVASDARTVRGGAETELQELRNEVASLRAQTGKRTTAS